MSQGLGLTACHAPHSKGHFCLSFAPELWSVKSRSGKRSKRKQRPTYQPCRGAKSEDTAQSWQETEGAVVGSWKDHQKSVDSSWKP